MAGDVGAPDLDAVIRRQKMHASAFAAANTSSLLQVPPLRGTSSEARREWLLKVETKLQGVRRCLKVDAIGGVEHAIWLEAAEETMMRRVATYLGEECEHTVAAWDARFTGASREPPATLGDLVSELETLFGDVDEGVEGLRELTQPRVEEVNTLLFAQSWCTKFKRYADHIVPDGAVEPAAVSFEEDHSAVAISDARSGPQKAGIELGVNVLGLQMFLSIVGDRKLVMKFHSRNVRTLPEALELLTNDDEFKEFRDRKLHRRGKPKSVDGRKDDDDDGKKKKKKKKKKGNRRRNGDDDGGAAGGAGGGGDGKRGKKKKRPKEPCTHCSKKMLGTDWWHKDSECRFKDVNDNTELKARFPAVWSEHERLKEKKRRGGGGGGGGGGDGTVNVTLAVVPATASAADAEEAEDADAAVEVDGADSADGAPDDGDARTAHVATVTARMSKATQSMRRG